MNGNVFLLLPVACLIACSPSNDYHNRAEAIAAQIHDPDSKYVVVACHRGDWRNYPENSAMAIESVIQMGADIMELDLKMTKDSVLVLSHDSTIDRCTTGSGRVSDYTYDELMQFNLKRAHGVKSDTTHILTLEQALSICKDRICVNVDQGYNYYDKVLEIANKLGVTDQILIKSKKSIAEVAENESKYDHNVMYMPVVEIQKEKGMVLFNSYINGNVVPLAYEVCWQTEDGTFEEACKKIIAQGSKVWVNTIWASLCGGVGNDDDAAYQAEDPSSVYQRYLDNGVSMIQTDRPELLIGFLKKKGRHTLKLSRIPQRYVHKAISIMDKNGLFAEGAQWTSAKNAALNSNPQTMNDAYSVVREALKVAGGKHSFLSPTHRVAEDKRRNWEMPSVSILDKNIASVKLPPFHGNKEEGLKYANAVLESVPDDISGVIIDLRGNVGGDMYPMIAAVHRFIPDGNDMLRFKSRKRTSWIPRSYVLNGAGVTEESYLDCPVAILTDSLTASSGEATLLCFRGLNNVKTFGCPTAGYASCNCPYEMPDGSSLVLTTGSDVARTNEEFCDNPIAPDVFTLQPEADAFQWIKSIIK